MPIKKKNLIPVIIVHFQDLVKVEDQGTEHVFFTCELSEIH